MARYGQFHVAYEARVDLHALRRERVEKACREMEQAGLDALLLWKYENVRYLTDLRAQIITGKSTLLNGVLLPGNGDPVLFVSGGEYDRVRRTMPWVQEVHIIPILEDPGLIEGTVRSVLAPVLREYGLERARLGIDAAPLALTAALQHHLPHMCVEDGDAPMQRARRTKLPDEIALIQAATALADAVTAAALSAIAPGVRECEVAAVAMETLYRLGGEYPHVITPFVASGEHMAPPHRFCTERLIQPGDIVFIDIGACWNGYFGDVGRTTVCGKPNLEQRRIYTAVYEALQAGIERMCPGNTNEDVAQTIRRTTERYGVDGRFLSLFIGHSIGMGANEPPYIGETLPGAPTYEFEPGMVFAVEPLIWVDGVPGGGGVRLEEMVAVTDNGPQVLSRAPFDERLLL